MGTPTVICGMSAPIAMTLQTMGADFRAAQTALVLEDALERLAVTVTVREIDPDTDFEDSQRQDSPFGGGDSQG